MKVTNEGRLANGALIANLGNDPDADTEDVTPPPDRAEDIPTYGPDLEEVVTLTSAPDGGWSHIQDPRALYLPAVDKTVFGYVDGTSGDVEVRTYDNALGTVSSSFNLHSALGGIDGNPDWHDAPAILRRDSDGKLVTIYAAHAATPIYRRISTNADDATAWAAETNLHASIGGTDYTYPYLTQLLGEASDPIYLFIRDGATTGTTSLIYSKSTDGGSTWSAKTVVFSGLAARDPYWKIVSNGVDRVDFFTTDASMPNDPGVVKTGHFYYTGGAYFKSDGTAMGAAPFDFTDITQIYDGSDGRGWPVDAVRDDDGGLRLLEQIWDVTETFDFIREFRYVSGSWVGNDVVSNTGAHLFASAVYDHRDFDTVYSGVKVAARMEMFRYRTTDDGLTWVADALTTSSAEDSGTPSPVFGRAPGSSIHDLAVIWFYGTWTNYNIFDLGILGFVTGTQLQGLTTDDDDTTYNTVVGGTDVLRIDLGTTYRIIRSRLRMSSQNAGSRTYSIYGATLADFSDEVLLDSSTFTATGSFTAQEVAFSWADDGIARQFFRLEGTAETRRIYTFELYEASSDLSEHVTDATDAHSASAIGIADVGSYYTGTDVEAALQEVGADLAAVPAITGFATPTVVLGTAAAAGAATTVIRSDSTIVAFDATVPVTQAAGDAAATGSAAVAARRDHRHGMPSSTSGIGEILISDTPSTPLIFADLLQNEAQDDLVYADPS